LIDYFALALTHALIVIALLRIAGRAELDREEFEAAADSPPETPADTVPIRRTRGKRRNA